MEKSMYSKTIGDKESSVRRLEAPIEGMLRILLEDLIAEKRGELAGWRPPTDFGIKTTEQEELLKKGIIERNARGQFRFNFGNHRVRRKLETFNLYFEQIDCFLEDVEKFKKAQKNLFQVSEMVLESPENWKYIIALGWWKMLESSEMPAEVKDIFEEGFSPKDWTITAIGSSTQFALDIAKKYGELENFSVVMDFLDKKGMCNKDDVVVPPSVTQDKVEKVKKILKWEDIKIELTEHIVKMLAFFWFSFFILESKQSFPVSTEYSLKMNKAIWNTLERLLRKNQLALMNDLENALKMLTENGMVWAQDILRLPGAI